VVAISIDPPEVSAKLAAGLGLRFPLASDVDHVAIEAYGVYDAENEISWPAVYLVEKDRTVSWRFLGNDYKERPPAADVLSAIDRIRAAR
jgi:peroxiredoxin